MNSDINPLIISDEKPDALAAEWLKKAEETEINDFNAMSLATSDLNGMPDLRVVLMKSFSERGFVFYTNMTSSKGEQIKSNMQAAINFHWKSLQRQMRARGPLEMVSEAESDSYFQSRRRGSRLASIASDQSSSLSGREELMERVSKLEEQYGANDEDGDFIPRPAHWYGHRLRPLYWEFWQDGEFRMHDRFVFKRENVDAPWGKADRLNP